MAVCGGNVAVLSSVARLSPRVIRVLGQNPGPMTLAGTNTYIVGTGTHRVLVDTGEGHPKYMSALHEALAMASSDKGEQVSISKVLMTHWHHDHVGGAPSVRAEFPQAVFYKQPSIVDGVDPTDGPYTWPEGDAVGVDGATVEWIRTPGHTDDHLSLRLREENAIFTGDCILGTGSSVFACYADFMASLQQLKELRPSILYPGHGPVVTDAASRIDEYIHHRQHREDQIAAALARIPTASVMQLVTTIYMDTPVHLHEAAAGNVLLQLRKLMKDGRVVMAGQPPPTALTLLSRSDYHLFKDESGDSPELRRAFHAVFHELRWALKV